MCLRGEESAAVQKVLSSLRKDRTSRAHAIGSWRDARNADDVFLESAPRGLLDDELDGVEGGE